MSGEATAIELRWDLRLRQIKAAQVRPTRAGGRATLRILPVQSNDLVLPLFPR